VLGVGPHVALSLAHARRGAEGLRRQGYTAASFVPMPMTRAFERGGRTWGGRAAALMARRDTLECTPRVRQANVSCGWTLLGDLWVHAL